MKDDYNKSLDDLSQWQGHGDGKRSAGRFWLVSVVIVTILAIVVGTVIGAKIMVKAVPPGYTKIIKNTNFLYGEVRVADKDSVYIKYFENCIFLPKHNSTKFEILVQYIDGVNGRLDGMVRYKLPIGEGLVKLIKEYGIINIESIDYVIETIVRDIATRQINNLKCIDVYEQSAIRSNLVGKVFKLLVEDERIKNMGLEIEVFEITQF